MIRRPLEAADTRAAVDAYRALGAGIETGDDWRVTGFGGRPSGGAAIEVANSGTTLYIALGSACLGDRETTITGDEQIQRRPAGPIADALRALGAKVESVRENGCAPLRASGPLRGGSIVLDGSKTSQYLTSLLINCPLADGDTVIEVENLVERPYVEMTLRWLQEQGIEIANHGFQRFEIPGGQHYKPFDKTVAADFSSATFFMCAAAIGGGPVELCGLDPHDTQGDKAVAGMLETMGANAQWRGNSLCVTGGRLTGALLDIGDTPDALPALAVTACFAEGETRLVNVAQARLKETDRISVMRRELARMGADVEELPDGLVIRGSRLRAADVDGHADHRVIMALAVAGMNADGTTTIDTAEALSVTFPTFVELTQRLGAHVEARR